MLKAALCGNYVNFGVFRLYGDSALDEALKMFVKLLVSIELKNLLVSPILGLVPSPIPMQLFKGNIENVGNGPGDEDAQCYSIDHTGYVDRPKYLNNY